jgi:hypothetical protein
MMIHKPSSIAWGNADEMRKEADVLDGCQKVILTTYMQHTKEGVTEEQINDLINAETWKNGEEWQEYFDIEIGESSNAAAAASDYYSKYNNLPESLTPEQPDETLTAEKIAAAVVEAIKDNLAAAQTLGDDLERQKAEILKDLDYI